MSAASAGGGLVGYASKAGRAITNPAQPEAQAVCDRCGMWYQRGKLRNQKDWRGAALLPLYLFVCDECYDTPQEQLRAIVVPADPMPVRFALVEPFLQDETNFHTATAPPTIDSATGIPIPGSTVFVTDAGAYMTEQPIGAPAGLEAAAVMPLFDGAPYRVALPLLSVSSLGTGPITVTCSSAHGLATNDQISVSGLSDKRACGFFSVAVTTATAFTYLPVPVIPSGALLTGATRIITAKVGVPLGFEQIPQV